MLKVSEFLKLFLSSWGSSFGGSTPNVLEFLNKFLGPNERSHEEKFLAS